MRDSKVSITRSQLTILLDKLERLLSLSMLPPLRQKDQKRSLVEEAETLLKQHEQESDRYSGRKNEPQVPRQLRQSRHRRPLPEHLLREIKRLEPAETCCPKCGGELDYPREVSAEQLELVSCALKVIRTEQIKKVCTKSDCIVKTSASPRQIEHNIASPRLFARVLTGKYCEHSAAGSPE